MSLTEERQFWKSESFGKKLVRMGVPPFDGADAVSERMSLLGRSLQIRRRLVYLACPLDDSNLQQSQSLFVLVNGLAH